jgi:hypothetical protein
MRKAIALAVVMLFAFAGTASAAPGRLAMVRGHYTYDFSHISGIAGDSRTVTLLAIDASSPSGVFLHRVNGTSYYTLGTVKCLAVSGPDAWVAGPVTQTQDGPADGSLWLLLRLHDGKMASGGGDEAMTFGETPADGLRLCRTMARGNLGAKLWPISSGNISVIAGH